MCCRRLFVYLWKHPEKYDAQRGTLKVWLSVVARSQAIDRYRALSQNSAVPLDDTILIEQADICDGVMDGEAKRMVSQESDVYFDEQIWERVRNIYNYYRDNMGTLLGYRS